MDSRRYFSALWANKFIVLGVFALYGTMALGSYALRAERPKAPPTDVVFVFDTTGSMQDKIDGLLHVSSRFASILNSTGSDFRLAMVTFGATEETAVVRRTFEPSSDLGAFKSFLRNTIAEGGGSEDQPTAMKYALSHFQYRKEAIKVLILVTDEPLLGSESVGTGAKIPHKDWDAIIKDVANKNVTAYSVCLNEEPFQALAVRTGGKFYDIESDDDFTDILLGIAAEINASITR